jgi:diguanylate cyclase (GGDEF)-like protein
MNPEVKRLYDYLLSMIYDLEQAELNVEDLPEDFRMLGKQLVLFQKSVEEVIKLLEYITEFFKNTDLPTTENELNICLEKLNIILKDVLPSRVHIDHFSDAFSAMMRQLALKHLEKIKKIENSCEKSLAFEKDNNFLFKAIVDQISQWVVVMDGSNFEWLYVSSEVDQVLSDLGTERQLRHWMGSQIYINQNNNQALSIDLKLKSDRVGSQYFTVNIYSMNWFKHKIFVFAFSDVTAEKKQIHRLQGMTRFDSMTMVYNRGYGMDLFKKWLTEEECFILCFIDLDNLKCVNDTFGHAEGDNYILYVVELLREFSVGSVICRLGGDEFMLHEKNINEQKAEEKYERLRTTLKSYYHNKTPYDCCISYGLVEIPAGSSISAAEWLNMADEKMYKYKRSHKAERRM